MDRAPGDSGPPQTALTPAADGLAAAWPKGASQGASGQQARAALPPSAAALGSIDGAVPPRVRVARPVRWRELFGAYLPLLLMFMLALFTWWLVKQSPASGGPAPPAAVRHAPDYSAERFVVERYDAQGRLSLRFDGDKVRHYPDRQEVEIDVVHLVATGLDGRITRATARQGVATDDGALVRLRGAAHVVSETPGAELLDITGENLLTLVNPQKVLAEQPATVRQGRRQFTADTLEYDQKHQLLTLHGRVRGVLGEGP
jgi:lipopolysaccharide export system protein LptC